MLQNVLRAVFIFGCLLLLTSHFLRKPGVPFVSFHPRDWKPFWKLREKYRAPGFSLAVAGLVCMWIGGLPVLITQLRAIGCAACQFLKIR